MVVCQKGVVEFNKNVWNFVLKLYINKAFLQQQVSILLEGFIDCLLISNIKTNIF